MKNQVQQLLDAGQSVWLDNRAPQHVRLRRAEAPDRATALRGMTSNPTIFEKAIGAGNDYDEQLATLIGIGERTPTRSSGISRSKIFRAPATRSRRSSMSSGGNDGFVSLEVSPLLAHDTTGTIAMAKELWARVEPPELMIKIPGTKEGIPAIEECDLRGAQHQRHADLLDRDVRAERRARTSRARAPHGREDKPIDKIRSVNSVFVSRIDTAVDKLLQDTHLQRRETRAAARERPASPASS